MHNMILVLMFWIVSSNSMSQKTKPFEGIISFEVKDVKANDSIRMETVIFCKDSLIKVVSFNELTGKQELLKHLTYGKSYLLFETQDQKYAVQTNEHLINEQTTYSFKKKCGRQKIGGLVSTKLEVKYKANQIPLTCYFSKKMDKKYANSMLNFPGFPTLFYTFSDRQIFKHTLINIEHKKLPLTFFMIPEDYKILSWEEFIELFSD